MKIDKAKLRQTIKQWEKNKANITGAKPLIFQKVIQDDFIKAVEVHGDNGYRILQYMENLKHPVTKRMIHTWLRQLFGHHVKMGRPSVYIQDGNVRDNKMALYK